MLNEFSKMMVKSHIELLNNARVIGMWELLIRLQCNNLVDSGEVRAIRDTIKEMEKEYAAKTD